MRVRRAAILAAALTATLLGGAVAASATSPVDLGAPFVLDHVGVLAPAGEQAAEERLSELAATTDVGLYAVLVDAFTDPPDSQEWADAVAERNGLGPHQYLLAVATESRQYYISADGAGPLDDAQITSIERSIEPLLRDDDFAGAVIATADGLEAALTGDTGTGGESGSGGGLVLFVLVAAIAVVLIWLFVRSRRKRPATGGGVARQAAEQLPIEELARRASSALVQTDDALKTSEQELGFARAQFGDAAAAEFEQALTLAKRNLDAAFAHKQKLDDHIPDTEQETRAWNAEIVRLCEEANAALDDKAAHFDELRKLEQNAPEALVRVQDARTKAADDIARARTHLQSLAASYAPQALATIADNPEQAEQRIAFADEQLALAQTAIGQGKGGEAAVSIRAAEEAVAQAALLEKAIDTLGHDLAEGEKNAVALLDELERDVAAAAALPDGDGRIASAIAATREQISAARANLAGTEKRPRYMLQNLEAANARIDEVVRAGRDAALQQQRATQMLGQQILQAQAQVSAAEDYITSRRGAIGAEARTRLAEAGASLVRAQQLQSTDPAQALQHAQRANQLASQAIQHAQHDVGAFSGGGFGGAAQGGGGGNMLGAVLGGIVINSLLGGGGSPSRSSGSRPRPGGGARPSGGMGSGGMGGGRRSGGLSPGSFGGGGTRGRRGGGRF